ncbi:MAG: L,D-transpeptidase [Candidatus Dormibacteria bacterium]
MSTAQPGGGGSAGDPGTGSPPRHRARWIALTALAAVLLGVGASVGIHSALGVGSRQERQLAAARRRAAQTISAARLAGLSASGLVKTLADSSLPAWSQTAISLVLGAGSLPQQMSREAAALERGAAELQPALQRWQAGMQTIDQERTEAQAQFTALLRALPTLKQSVVAHEAKLSWTGAVPLAQQPATLATLTSADIWAGELHISAQSAAGQIAQDRALVTQAGQLNISPGNAASEIQQAQSQLGGAQSSSAVTAILDNLSQELLPLQVDVRAADPGPGQVIVVRLAAQSLTAYQSGRPVLQTLVTTGRRGLRTPIGLDTITWRQTPYLFISPWPQGNPYYYPPSWVTWVLHFHSGGYFIHNAPWEPNSVYGPGSENTSYASHGCVQVPYTAMQFLWNWTKTGATVVIAP